MLKIDYTLIIQVVNFLILLYILNAILYRPIRRILNERRKKMDSFETVIGDFLNKTDQHERDLEGNILEARQEGHQTKEGLKGDGLEVEKSLVRDAAVTAGEKVQKAKEEIEKKMLDVRQSLREEASVFSRDLAEKILGRSL